MVWLQNDGLLGFLFKSIVPLWASNGLLIMEDHLKPVLFLFFTFTATLLWKPVWKPVVLKLWKNKWFDSKMTASGLLIQICCLIMGFQRASLCGRPSEVRVSFICQSFCESPSRSPWYLNSDSNTNGLAPKWRGSGLPVQIYCFTLGFQRASLCGRPFEASVSFYFSPFH